jgi:ATP-dependent DNA helicase RecQ
VAPPEWDSTLAAQKFLSCVYRIREKSGFGVGILHVVDVLRGGNTKKVRQFGHRALSTYGIGAELRREEWVDIGRQLIRLRLLRRRVDEFGIVQLTDEGLAALKSRRAIALKRPAV